MSRENIALTADQKLELLKEELGWYFGGVAPKDWNPFKNIGHLGYLLKFVSKRDGVSEYFENAVKQPIFKTLMIPFCDPVMGIDICGSFLGLWPVIVDFATDRKRA